MRRGILHFLAWALATAVAMALSWYGVRTVLTDTAHEPPLALPAPDTAPSAPAPLDPSVPATPAVRPSPSPPSTPAPPPVAASTGGAVRSYPVRGGRAVFALGGSSATLVSAAPEEGWRMRVWKQDGWIRVDFTAGPRTSSLFVTWNGHPPLVHAVEDQ
ncbi:hypothetical protein [Streptomyces sp. UNOB3_S3]|uniref:hypothetical protein n=1 Tax=Streptomyces sp. UNOB3_S3 TaxID=2871682 RepID=UPI001E3077F2|nr:hypothetical protein [Streptomyces sp. UNOB3_S3]MCC3778687.1 hypothetical protein [Streptomyces sp. UNOB3_S3]